MARKKDSVQLLAERIVEEYKTKEALFGETGFIKDLQKRLYEAALNGELTDHLGYDKHAKQSIQTNARNGYTPKVVQGEHGTVEIEVPRDRDASFEPQLIGKRQRRFDGLDDKIISLYARGLSTQDIQAQLEDLYGVDVSSSLISTVTDSVLDDVRAWQSRPLDSVYPIAYLDCIVVKVRQDRRIINKSVYLALGVNLEGHKELLGMWISANEGAKFWLGVLTELKNRGLQDIFIACVDGNRIPRGDRSCVPTNESSVMHCPYGT